MNADRSLTFLDASGDVTFVWDETTDAAMQKIIESRMEQGYKFYILKPRAIPLLPPRKVLAKSIAEIKEAGSVSILDEDINTLFANGNIRTMKPANDIEIERKATTAKEVVRSQSVAVKPARGG